MNKRIALALCGGAILAATSTGSAAAGRLVTGSDIKDGSITSRDIRDGALRARDISARASSVTASTASIVYTTAAASFPVGVSAASAHCPSGTMVTGGGFSTPPGSEVRVTNSRPLPPALAGGWYVQVSNGSASTVDGQVWAACLRP